jgi:hypothetical protein
MRLFLVLTALFAFGACGLDLEEQAPPPPAKSIKTVRQAQHVDNPGQTTGAGP